MSFFGGDCVHDLLFQLISKGLKISEGNYWVFSPSKVKRHETDIFVFFVNYIKSGQKILWELCMNCTVIVCLRV